MLSFRLKVLTTVKNAIPFFFAILIGAALAFGPFLLWGRSETSYRDRNEIYFLLDSLIRLGLPTAFSILTIRLPRIRKYSLLAAITYYSASFLSATYIQERSLENMLIYNGFGFLCILASHFLLPRLPYGSIKDLERPDSSIKRIITSLFDTPAFLTALRTTLPKGQKDEEYGLDFIPFMLHSTDEKRKRFEKSSRRFLILTITMSIVFSSILVLFGYILINEAAAGLPRTLVHIEETTAEIQSDLSKVTNKSIQDALSEEGFKIGGVIPQSMLNDPMILDLDYRLISAYGANDLSGLQRIIEDGIQKTSDGKYDNLKGRLQELKQKVNRIILEKQRRFDSIEANFAKLNSFQTSAENKLEASNYRTSEILKRIAVGLIITTFFLAILRFVGGLYKDNYNQVLLAEQDDLAIRRFYVSFKCAKGDNDAVKSLVTQFMISSSILNKSEDGKGGVPAVSNGKIIEELLAALTKKL